MRALFKACFVLFLIVLTANTRVQAQMVENENAPTESEFLKRNKTIRSLSWKSNFLLILTLKTGKTEAYDINTSKGRQRFYKKYGSYPMPPASPNSRVSRRMPKGKS